ncbi:hypothetical protein FRC03_003053 [Tulasnella sp. 419]|nr:hypothetical protein FRC02_004296 [Tulasnella sp. 418]KAG8963398.1 hypothetical protein FRC03_003053 [Tulasnella sp. 419]
MSSITHITSSSQLDGLLSSAGSKLTVIDFHATWCGPCHAIAPKFEALSKEYKNAQFLKCDVDACQEVARKYSISAMPSFIFIKDGSKIDMVRGADPRSLENTIKKHAGSASFGGKGQTLGGASSSPSAGAAPTPPAAGGLTNLDPQVKLFLGLLGVYLVIWFFK